jgi:hypothetical protein
VLPCPRKRLNTAQPASQVGSSLAGVDLMNHFTSNGTYSYKRFCERKAASNGVSRVHTSNILRSFRPFVKDSRKRNCHIALPAG